MIDVQKVVEAQETVLEAETELRRKVKKYLEEQKTFEKKVANAIELKQRFDGDQEIMEFTLENELEIFLVFHRHEYSEWDYSISCEQLKIYYLRPVTENTLSAQGELTFKYIAPETSAEREIKLRKYLS